MEVGRAWLEAARRGDQQSMEGMGGAVVHKAARIPLLSYRGEGTSLGMIGHSALHWAAAKGHAPLASWLIGARADVELRNNAASTPLHTAAANGKMDIARILLAAGARTDTSDSEGKSPRDVALERGHSALGRAIEEHAAQAAGRISLARLAASDNWKVTLDT